MNNPQQDSLAMDPLLQSALTPRQPGLPSYQQGGLVTPSGPPGGVPSQPPQPQQPMDPKMLDMHINQFASQHPQELAQIKQAIFQALQSGEMTPQELNMMVQLATVAAQNPQMYPQIRQYAIRQGLAGEQDLPQQFDQGLVMALLLAAKATQQDLGGSPVGSSPIANAGPMTGGPIPAMNGPGMIPSMEGGGFTGNRGGGAKVGDGKGGFLMVGHPREYMIDENTLVYHGKKTFDAMRDKALEDKMGGKPKSK